MKDARDATTAHNESPRSPTQPENVGASPHPEVTPPAAEEIADEQGNRALHKVASGANPHVERHEPAPEAGGDKTPAGRW